jgi:hypothetical protein
MGHCLLSLLPAKANSPEKKNPHRRFQSQFNESLGMGGCLAGPYDPLEDDLTRSLPLIKRRPSFSSPQQATAVVSPPGDSHLDLEFSKSRYRSSNVFGAKPLDVTRGPNQYDPLGFPINKVGYENPNGLNNYFGNLYGGRTVKPG